MEEHRQVPPLQKTNILGVHYAVTSMDGAAACIMEKLESWRGEYICAGNVHTTVMAHDDPEFLKTENGAVMVLPDGRPISILQRRCGYPEAGQVTGPDLLLKLFEKGTSRGYRHFFYGSTQETLDRLGENLLNGCPAGQIAGSIPSVFRDMTVEENDALVEKINAAQPDVLWVGLGAPRQEQFMAKNKGRIRALMIGVGGAFARFAGETKTPPKWVQKCCLEWLFRLLQEPKRLFKRYFVTNTRFLYLLATEQRKWKNT